MTVCNTYKSTLIVGLGNPILGDDGVGWRVAEEVSKQSGIPMGDAPLPGLHDLEQEPVTIECYSLAGLSLMERLIGYDRVILIDALNTGKHPQGEVVCFTLDDMEDLTHGHTTSAHDVSLKQALKLGRSMGESLPDDNQVYIIAVEASHVYDFQEELSPAIAAAVPMAMQKVLKLIDNKNNL
ncbi:MAG: hydrogenase maturation protease [Candidatus Electrothrix aestuarii]|uniref:Hydrogenase maturation protease n=1 Tax=Candidatus Electrothrix aestuarii TaxID=3062594 RepID=A0AAU8LWN8_9BACT|nr:hydrogenase maturation protease [Candidatus Electrothrix aestuarii]